MPIITAAPWVEALGTKDGSSRLRPITRVPVPSHLPLIMGYAQKGDTNMNLVLGNSAKKVYGDDIFDVRSPFATHQTVLANEINSVGNAFMFKRVIPEDAPPPANVRISIELVKTKVNPKERLTDGSYKLTQGGDTIAASQPVDGHIAKFVAEYITPGSEQESNFGKGVKKTGTLQGTSSEESTRYPLFDLEVSSQGSWGNLQGIRIWSDSVHGSTPVNESLVRHQKAYPYFFSFVEKEDENSTAKTVYADTGEQHVQLTLKENTFDKNTDSDYYFGTELLRRWAMPNAASHLKPTGPFGRLHVYQANIEEVHTKIVEAEKKLMETYPGMLHDFVNGETDHYRLNLFGGFTTQGVPYISYQINKENVVGERVLRFTERSNIMASGGGDGTMSPEGFAKLVANEFKAFADQNSHYLNPILYPISVFYDTGFPMETKRQLGKFLAIRKDVALALVPSAFGEREPTPAEESSICVALRTIMQAYPESSFFATPVMRGMVFAHTGVLTSSRYRHRAPLVIEAARKFAKYMGASNGIWKSEYAPDRSPNNQVEMFTDLSSAYKPASVRNRDWKAGMIWVDPFDIDKFYWPALRTVYEDDTSILTSALTVFCICELVKIGYRVHAEFSGRSDLTNLQLKERKEARCNELIRGRFDERFDITPTVDFTKQDILRGYSDTLKFTIRGNNMKTVQTLWVEALRFEENDVATTEQNLI